MSRIRNKILEEFIEIYKYEPCLWNGSSKDYHNQKKRNVAYAKLLDKLRELEPDAERDTCVKKINSLRCNVRKETKKIEESWKSASTPDEVYEPRLWYYHLFDFLKDRGATRESSNGTALEEDSYYSGGEDSIQERQKPALLKFECAILSEEDETAIKTDTTDNKYSNLPQMVCKKRKAREEEELSPARKQEDRYDLFGRTVAMRLRGLDERQRLIVEKNINDILFEAEIKRFSDISTPPYPPASL